MRSSKGFMLQPLQPTASPIPRSGGGLLPPKSKLPTNQQFDSDRVSKDSVTYSITRSVTANFCNNYSSLFWKTKTVN